jgi:hypothetical protein
MGTKKDVMQKDVMKKLQRKKSGMTEMDGEHYLWNNPKKIGCQNNTGVRFFENGALGKSMDKHSTLLVK